MTDSEEHVVLVNERDEPLGTMGKLEAHRVGALHRAFSVFVFDEKGRLLMQRRAAGKYHSAGLWTNTCCGHPRSDEEVAIAARRRLQEEMGIDVELHTRFQFQYKAEFENKLMEHEVDHVLFGQFSGDPNPNANEVQEWAHVEPMLLDRDLRERPERYTAWLLRCWPRVVEEIRGEEHP